MDADHSRVNPRGLYLKALRNKEILRYVHYACGYVIDEDIVTF